MSRLPERLTTGVECVAPAGHCITCADEGTPMTVLTGAEDGLARCVDDRGGRGEVEVTLVGTVGPGDRLLVHAATAIARLEADPA